MNTADTTELNLDSSTQPEAAEIDLDNEDDGGAPAANAEQPGAGEAGGEGSADEGGEEGEFAFQFGDEAPPASDGQGAEGENSTIREMRQRIVELSRTVRHYEVQVQTQQPQQATVPTLSAKPKLEDFDYDEGKYDEALGKWYADKAKVDAAQADQERVAQERQRARDERLNSYRTEAAGLRVKDFQDVEGDVVAALSVDQQGILLAGADKPATLVYALGRYPNKLRTLAQIKDPVRFAFAAGKLEGTLKVANRPANSKPAPEGRVSSTSGVPSGGGEKKLEQLRAEAAKTGDYTKVNAYKRQLKQAQARK